MIRSQFSRRGVITVRDAMVMVMLAGCAAPSISGTEQAVVAPPDAEPVSIDADACSADGDGPAVACPQGTTATPNNTIDCPMMIAFAGVWDTLTEPCWQAAADAGRDYIVGKWYYGYRSECTATSGTPLPPNDLRYANNRPFCLLYPNDPARYVSGCEVPPNPPPAPLAFQAWSGSFGPFDDLETCTAAQNARRNGDATGECRNTYRVLHGRNPDGISRVERLNGTCCLDSQ
jgi:hypothetical protein